MSFNGWYLEKMGFSRNVRLKNDYFSFDEHHKLNLRMHKTASFISQRRFFSLQKNFSSYNQGNFIWWLGCHTQKWRLRDKKSDEAILNVFVEKNDFIFKKELFFENARFSNDRKLSHIGTKRNFRKF